MLVARLDRRRHRRLVGGYWGRLGELQLDFLKSEGLEPNAAFIDVGCGALRAGIHFVDYLEAGNYYGIDIDEQLLAIGYKVELPKRLRSKLPRAHLRCTPRFDLDFRRQVRHGNRSLCVHAHLPDAGTKRPARFTERNPYWYLPDDLEWAAAVAPWRFRYIGDWGHPREQKMVEFLRVENPL